MVLFNQTFVHIVLIHIIWIIESAARSIWATRSEQLGCAPSKKISVHYRLIVHWATGYQGVHRPASLSSPGVISIPVFENNMIVFLLERQHYNLFHDVYWMICFLLVYLFDSGGKFEIEFKLNLGYLRIWHKTRQVKALWNRDWRMNDWRDASKANFLESYFWFCKIPIIIVDVPA